MLPGARRAAACTAPVDTAESRSCSVSLSLLPRSCSCASGLRARGALSLVFGTLAGPWLHPSLRAAMERRARGQHMASIQHLPEHEQRAHAHAAASTSTCDAVSKHEEHYEEAYILYISAHSGDPEMPATAPARGGL